MPPEPDTAEFSKGPVFNRVANYFAGQPFGNLLSTIVICGFGYWFWWSQTQGEPQKIKQIQDNIAAVNATNAESTATMIKAMAAANSESHKATAAANAEAIKKIIEEHTAQTKLMIDHGESSAARREKDGQHIEEIMREFLNGRKGIEKKGAAADSPPDTLSFGPLLE